MNTLRNPYGSVWTVIGRHGMRLYEPHSSHDTSEHVQEQSNQLSNRDTTDISVTDSCVNIVDEGQTVEDLELFRRASSTCKQSVRYTF